MWSVYNDMEGEFIRFLDYVPPSPEHKKVYSYNLLRLILQIGGYVDTAFKEMALHSMFDGNQKCEEIRKKAVKGRTVGIDLSREAFEPIYTLSRRTVFVKSPKHYALLIDRFCPFAEFRNGKAPKWWKAYNGIKHDWLKNLKKANLENTFGALGGAFLMNVIHEPSLLELAKRRIAQTFTAGWRQAVFADELLAKWIMGERPIGENIVMVDTRVFRWRFG